MNAAVIAAVRVPPSALSTSASMWIVQGPSALRSTTARRLRPISRWISVARPSVPRLIRDGVLPGSMAYSAVSQPIDFPSRNGGTVSDRLAVTSTAVSPQRYSTLPGLLRTNPRSMVTGRSWSLVRLIRSGHVRAPILRLSSRDTVRDREHATLMRGLLDSDPSSQTRERHLKMEPVGRLGDDLAARAVEHVGGHFFAAMGGKAVEEDRVGLGLRQQVVIDLIGGEDAAPRFGLVLLSHARPDVGIDDVGAFDRLVGIVFDHQGNGGKPGREPRLEVGRKLVARRRGQHELDAEKGRGRRQRPRDVVAVADEHQLLAAQAARAALRSS